MTPQPPDYTDNVVGFPGGTDRNREAWNLGKAVQDTYGRLRDALARPASPELFADPADIGDGDHLIDGWLHAPKVSAPAPTGQPVSALRPTHRIVALGVTRNGGLCAVIDEPGAQHPNPTFWTGSTTDGRVCQLTSRRSAQVAVRRTDFDRWSVDDTTLYVRRQPGDRHFVPYTRIDPRHGVGLIVQQPKRWLDELGAAEVADRRHPPTAVLILDAPVDRLRS